MGLQLPGGLASFLQILGYTWPESDETKLFEMGRRWSDFSGTLREIAGSGDRAASAVWNDNTGADISAFQGHWGGQDGPSRVIADTSTASTLVGTGMTIFSAIVLALKVQVIVQLTILAIQTAQAIAAAPATFGASLSWIPIYQQISRRIVGQLINQVITQLLKA